jgi:hypothetical protein
MPPMILHPACAPRARRWWLAGLVAVALAAGGVSYALVSDAGAAGVITTGSVGKFRAAIIVRMHAEHLDYHWVACVPSGNRFEGVRIVRCNVDFGEPHIVAYCSVFRNDRLLTSEDDPAIPCGHDNAGYSAPIVTYP